MGNRSTTVEIEGIRFRRCATCREEKPLSEFRLRTGGRWHVSNCQSCNRAIFRQKNKARYVPVPRDQAKLVGKTCRTCGETKPLAGFYKSSNRGTVYGSVSSICKKCDQAKVHAYGRAHPEKRRKWARNANRRTVLRTRYALTPARYAEMLNEQQGVCAICKQPETRRSSKFGHLDPLSVDHDHSTGVVRGLLCAHCNRGLGAFKDNVGFLNMAAEYLQTVRPILETAQSAGKNVTIQ